MKNRSVEISKRICEVALSITYVFALILSLVCVLAALALALWCKTHDIAITIYPVKLSTGDFFPLQLFVVPVFVFVSAVYYFRNRRIRSVVYAIVSSIGGLSLLMTPTNSHVSMDFSFSLGLIYLLVLASLVILSCFSHFLEHVRKG